jgi:hypothetical protein
VLAETARTIERRKQLARTVKDILGGIPDAPPGTAAPGDFDFRLIFTVVVANKQWRVVVTKDHGDACRSARLATAATPLVEACFGVPVSPQPRQSLYLLATAAEVERALRADPRFTDGRVVQFGGAAAPAANRVLVWGTDTPARLQRVARQAVALVVEREFGLTPSTGWAWEGIGLYLAGLLTGDYPARCVREEELTHSKFRLSRLMSYMDWYGLTMELVHEGRAPALRELLRRSATSLDPDEVLLSYAFAAYLIEGHAAQAAKLLKGSPEQLASAGKVAAALGYDAPELEERFRTWLLELE